MAINFSPLGTLPFGKLFPAVFSDGNFIYYIAGTPSGIQTLSGYSFKSGDGLNWEVVASAGPMASDNRGFFFDEQYWLLQNEIMGSRTSAYSSSDAISWTFRGTTPGSTYDGNNVNISINFSYCFHKGRIYLTGYNNGFNYGGGSRAVISTTDFVTYIVHQNDDASSSFPRRSNAGFYSNGESLFILGGVSETGSLAYLTDFWRSDDDGANWTLVDSSINSTISSSLHINGTGRGQNSGRMFVGRDFYGVGTSNVVYAINGGTPDLTSQIGLPGGFVKNVVYLDGNFFSVGYSYEFISTVSTQTYVSTSAFFPSTNRISFESSVIHSPSPAFIRLTDTSDISASTDSYTRLWSIRNNRTSAIIYYTSEESYIDLSVSGIYGDTFDVSLSAVW